MNILSSNPMWYAFGLGGRLLCQEFLPRPPIVFRPTLSHAFVVILWHAHMHQVDFRPTIDAAERQNQNRPIHFLPMASAPQLNDSLFRNNRNVLSTNRPTESGKRPAHFSADFLQACQSTLRAHANSGTSQIISWEWLETAPFC